MARIENNQEIEMKILNAKKITADFDTKSGFAWVTFTNDDQEFTLQACLLEPKKCLEDNDYRRKLWSDDSVNKFIKQIKISDDGMRDGLCKDANDSSFKEFGIDVCRVFFYKEIKKIGIRVI